MTLTERELGEARNIARKVSHRPAVEIAQIINERMRLKKRSITADQARDLLKG